MKKIERIERLDEQRAGFTQICVTVNALVDAHNELLDTHTVKEPERLKWYERAVHKPGYDVIPSTPLSNNENGAKEEPTNTVKEEPLKNWKGCPDCFYGEGEDHDIECESLKEEPTTPEKKCTDLRHMGMGESFYCPSPIHQEKLPTSYYEVTCGRSEKSFKHSCGKV